MNDQQETTANAPTEPKLCRQGCGFFGSNATGDCCSKCWNDMQKKATAAAPAPAAPAPAPVAATVVAPPPSPPTQSVTAPAPAAEPEAMEVDTAVAAAPSPAKKTKKKKKMGYKAMMAAMKEGSGERDAEKEKETIKKVTGGGAFVKVDKI